jgi:hypothetical protein
VEDSGTVAVLPGVLDARTSGSGSRGLSSSLFVTAGFPPADLCRDPLGVGAQVREVDRRGVGLLAPFGAASAQLLVIGERTARVAESVGRGRALLIRLFHLSRLSVVVFGWVFGVFVFGVFVFVCVVFKTAQRWI